jgi:tetratricopeptide (TPR) repeat protein
VTYAYKVARDAVDRNNLDVRYLLLAAFLAQQLGKFKEASDFSQSAIDVAPFNAEGYYYYGLSLLQQKDYKKAEEVLKRAVLLGKFSNPRYYNLLADTYHLQGKVAETVKILEEAINVAFPLNKSFFAFEYIYDATGFKNDLSNTYLKLAILYRIQGNTKQADKLFAVIKKDLKIKNPTVDIRYLL